jgi:hypothetical protein
MVVAAKRLSQGPIFCAEHERNRAGSRTPLTVMMQDTDARAPSPFASLQPRAVLAAGVASPPPPKHAVGEMMRACLCVCVFVRVCVCVYVCVCVSHTCVIGLLLFS